jgi:hypothetical protein
LRLEQINLIPAPAAQAHSLGSRLPRLPINTVLPLLSAAAPADLTGDHTDDSSRDVEAAQKLDDQTFALLKSLQLQGASGHALELISPQLDGISDPNARLKFASILFDMIGIASTMQRFCSNKLKLITETRIPDTGG